MDDKERKTLLEVADKLRALADTKVPNWAKYIYIDRPSSYGYVPGQYYMVTKYVDENQFHTIGPDGKELPWSCGSDFWVLSYSDEKPEDDPLPCAECYLIMSLGV